MRKKIILLLSFICVFALTLGIAAGCKNDKDKVTVTLNRTELSVLVGETSSSRIIATTSDGSKVTWSSDNEAVATVNNGSVTGVSEGTAKVTATSGKASASCTVTVSKPTGVIFKVDGEVKSSIEIVWEDSVTLTTETTDGSAISSWTSSDTEVATVSNGTITAVGLGEATITAKTANGSSSKLTVNVVIPADGSKYPVNALKEGEKAPNNQWYYFARTDGGRTPYVDAEYRNNKLTFDVSEGSAGWNWTQDSLGIIYKNPEIAGNSTWHKLTLKIKSSITTSITVHETRVDLVENQETVATVYYQQYDDQGSIVIYLMNGDAGTAPNNIKIEVSEYTWADWTVVDLVTPTFTMDGNNITINDDANTANTAGIKNYEIGLFNGDTLVYNQLIDGKTGTLDTSLVEGKNGTYTVRVKVNGVPGYKDSEWTTGNDYTHTINNTNVFYYLDQGTDPQHKGTPGAAMTSGRWEYAITDGPGEGVVFHSAQYENGTVTFSVYNGWAFDSAQLMRHYSEYAAGTELTVKMTLTLDRSGKITVCDHVEDMVANQAKTVEYKITQKAGDPTIMIFLNTLAKDDSEWPGKLLGEGSLGVGDVVFTVSNVTVTPTPKA